MSTINDSPSKYYKDKEGREYFAYAQSGSKNSSWSLWIWEPHVDPEDDLIEFGCGGGQLLGLLKARKKVGIDVNPAAVEHATSLGLDVRESLDDIPSGSFTKAISSHALEHVESPHETLRNIRRVLRPGGQLILLLPLDDWRSRAHKKYRSDDPNKHLYAWTPQSLGNLLDAAGFTPKSVRVLTHGRPPRGGETLLKLHPALYHFAAYWTAKLLYYRQLLAVAEVAPDPSPSDRTEGGWGRTRGRA